MDPDLAYTVAFRLDAEVAPERGPWLVVTTDYAGDIGAAIRRRCDVADALARNVALADIADSICCMLADEEINAIVAPANMRQLLLP